MLACWRITTAISLTLDHFPFWFQRFANLSYTILSSTIHANYRQTNQLRKIFQCCSKKKKRNSLESLQVRRGSQFFQEQNEPQMKKGQNAFRNPYLRIEMTLKNVLNHFLAGDFAWESHLVIEWGRQGRKRTRDREKERKGEEKKDTGHA